MTTTIQAIYKCPYCESEYKTQEEAENCRNLPWWPRDTKYAVLGRWDSEKELYKVHVQPRNESECRQWVSIRKHPASGKESVGRCFIADKDPNDDRCGRFRPLTREQAESNAGDLERRARSLKREALKLEKLAKVYREIAPECPEQAAKE